MVGDALPNGRPPTSEVPSGPPPALAGVAPWLRTTLLVVAATTALQVPASLWVFSRLDGPHRAPVSGISALDAPVALLVDIGVATSVSTMAASILFLVWFWRASRWLPVLGFTPRLRQSWAAWAWIVPVVNLVLPKRLVDDVWRASDPTAAPEDPGWRRRPVPSFLNWWWGLWVLHLVLVALSAGADWEHLSVSQGRALLRLTSADAVVATAAAVMAASVVATLTARLYARLGSAGGADDGRRPPGGPPRPPAAAPPRPDVSPPSAPPESAPPGSVLAGPPRRVRWGIGDFLLAELAGFGGAFLALAVLVAAGQAGGAEGLPTWTQFWVLLPAQSAATLAVLWWISRAKGSGALRRDFGFELRARHWWFLLAGVGLQLLLILLLIPFVQLLENHQTTQDVVEALDETRGATRVAAAAGAGVVAPVVEELLFRGLLLRALLRRMSSGWAIGATSAVFAAAHLFGTGLRVEALPTVVGLGGLGIVLAVLAIRDGSLSRPIQLHMGFNLAAVALSYVG